MAIGHPIGTVFVELDLDPSRYMKGQQQLLKDATSASTILEQNFKNLGIKSAAHYDLLRSKIQLSYDAILKNAKSTANDIIRAEEAKHARLKAINEEQYGKQISLIDSLRKNWLAVSAAVIGAYMAVQKVYSFSKEIAEATNEIERNAKIAGLSTNEYQKWAYAAKMADLDTHELSNSFRFLSRAMSEAQQGEGNAADAFKVMGVSVTEAGGTLKSLDVMMKEIMDKFAGWADGPAKIALSLAIFGRSGEALIPLLNKGAGGFAEFAREAEKLGFVLDPGVIKAGSEAEDIFKKINVQITATKNNLAPLALEFSKLLKELAESVAESAKFWGGMAKGYLDYSKHVTGLIFGTKKAEMPPPLELAISHGPSYESAYKTAAPAIINPEVALESEKILIGQRLKYAEITKDVEAQVRLTKDLAANEKARLAEHGKLTTELNKQIDVMAGVKAGELRRTEEQRQLGISDALIKSREQYAGIIGDLQEQVNLLDKQLANRLQGLSLEVQAGNLSKSQANEQMKIAIALNDQVKLRFADTGALSIHQKAIYEDSLRYMGSMININGEYATMMGNLKEIEKAEQDSLDLQIFTNAYVAEEYMKLQQILDLKQKRRREDIEIIAQGRANLSILDAQINAQNAFNQIKVGLGWMRPEEAGFAQWSSEKKMLDMRLEQAKAEAAVNRDLMTQPKLLADIQILQIQIAAKEKERIQFISLYGTALEGLRSGFQKYVTETGTEFTRMQEAAYNVSKSMESAFMTFYDDVIFEGKNFKESMLNMFQGLSRSIINELMKAMIIKPLVASITGGLGGLLPFAGGGIVEGFRPLEIPRFANGTVVNKPTLAIVGEGGEDEYIIPKSKMGGGQGTPINIINVNDPRQMDQWAASSYGTNAIINVIGSNKEMIKRILR